MKACPGSKFDEIETAFRANEFNYYLFALVGPYSCVEVYSFGIDIYCRTARSNITSVLSVLTENPMPNTLGP